MARGCLSLVLLGLLVGGALCRVPDILQHGASNDQCGACKIAMHVLSDALCDPYVDDTVVQWVVGNICSQMGENKEQCANLVAGLTPALVEWLRANANPDVLCAEAGVCGAPSLKALTQAKPLHSSHRPNDLTCPLCMYVAGKVKEQINDPTTQADIHSASLAACAALPEGVMRDACTTFVEQYEMTFVKYIGSMEPAEVCMMIGTCLDAALERIGRPAPLTANSIMAASQLLALLQAPPSNDQCDVCKVMVTEMHQLVANPELQVQMVDYAKQACSLVPSFAETCQADVDQYAPMVFGMILAYLQPEQVCMELRMCPPPSWTQTLALQASVLSNKFNKFTSTKIIRA